jgi:uncharacterized membrane protein YeiH
VHDLPPGHDPLAWTSHPDYVLITIGAASIAAASAKWLRHRQLKIFTAADSSGAS